MVTTVALTVLGSTKPLYHVTGSWAGSTYSGTGVGVGEGVKGPVGEGVGASVTSVADAVVSGVEVVVTLASGALLQAAKAVAKTATDDIAKIDNLILSVLK